MPAALNEKQVEEIWLNYLPGRTGLVTEENEPLEIIYPGRKNNDPGADFRDAIITTGKGLLRGDVEIHVNSSSWREHGHHADPNYNRAILHVVYRHDSRSGTVLQNGCKIPTLALDKYIDVPAAGKIAAVMAGAVFPPPRCRTVHQADTVATGAALDAAGMERFAARAGSFQAEIAGQGAGQALYRGIMTALGYSRNKGPMAELARLVPLRELENAIRNGPADGEYLAYLQARLLGAAGLLPPRVEAGYFEADTRVYKPGKIGTVNRERAQMSAGDWHFFKVRPGNYPTRRIAAMSHLLLRYRETGLLEGLTRKIRETSTNRKPQRLEESVFIGAGDGLPALLGRERAADIVINVLLPFAAATGRINRCPEETAGALELYRCYPAAAENMVVKEMRQKLGIGGNTLKTARRQQGLIHIYKKFCQTDNCRGCPVGPAVVETVKSLNYPR
jgi:hypothetical protein